MARSRWEMDWSDTGLYNHRMSDITRLVRAWDEPCGLDVRGDPTSFRDYAGDGQVVLDSVGGVLDPQSEAGISRAILTSQHLYRHVVEYDDGTEQVVYEALAQPPTLEGEGSTRIAIFHLVGKTQTARLDGVRALPTVETTVTNIVTRVGNILGGTDRVVLPELGILLRLIPEDATIQTFIEDLALHAGSLGFEGPTGRWNFINLDLVQDIQDGVLTSDLVRIHDDGYETVREPGLIRNQFNNRFHGAEFTSTESLVQSGPVWVLSELQGVRRQNRLVVLESLGSNRYRMRHYSEDGTRHTDDEFTFTQGDGGFSSLAATEYKWLISEVSGTTDTVVGDWGGNLRPFEGYETNRGALGSESGGFGLSRTRDFDYVLFSENAGSFVKRFTHRGGGETRLPLTPRLPRGGSGLTAVEDGLYIVADSQARFYRSSDWNYVASRSFAVNSRATGITVTPASFWVLENGGDTLQAYNVRTRARESARDISLGSGSFPGVSYTSRPVALPEVE